MRSKHGNRAAATIRQLSLNLIRNVYYKPIARGCERQLLHPPIVSLEKALAIRHFTADPLNRYHICMFDKLWHGTLRRPYHLYMTSHGDENKPPVILLHGIAASGEDWGKLIPLLTPYFRCITIDLLGFGESPKPQWADYSMEQHVRSIHEAIQSLLLKDEYILIGHSMGSLLATRYARRHPGQIKRLLLLSPPVYPPLDTIEGRLALKRTDLLMHVYRFLRKSPRMTPVNIRRLALLGVIPQSIVKRPDTWIPFKRSLEHCIEQQTIRRDLRKVRDQIPIDVFYGVLDSVVVGPNVRSLAKIREVSVHSFRGNHKLGSHYAKVVADQLLQAEQPIIAGP